MKQYLLPIAHPAFIMRGNYHLDPAQQEYLDRARRLLDNRWTPYNINEPPPGDIKLHPSYSDLVAFRLAAPPRTRWYYDIECAGPVLRCVGFGYFQLDDTFSYVCVHLRTQGGAVYEPDELPLRARWLADVLNDEEILLVPHNGVSFDTRVLESVGFRVNSTLDDTMVKAHYAYPEMPKGLQFLAITHVGVTGWKSLVREDEDAEGKG